MWGEMDSGERDGGTNEERRRPRGEPSNRTRVYSPGRVIYILHTMVILHRKYGMEPRRIKSLFTNAGTKIEVNITTPLHKMPCSLHVERSTAAEISQSHLTNRRNRFLQSHIYTLTALKYKYQKAS